MCFCVHKLLISYLPYQLITTGEVKGKYGYIDADGNLREISYGADKHGFNPEGTDINVPPRTIHSENDNRYPSLKPGEIDDGQYREDPNIYLNSKYNAIPAVKKAKSYSPPQNFNYQTTETPVYEEPQTQAPQFYQSRFQAPVQQQSYFKKPQQQQQNYYQQPNHQQPNYYQPKNNYQQQQQTPNIFAGHPAQNFDVFSGSYTVQY